MKKKLIVLLALGSLAMGEMTTYEWITYSEGQSTAYIEATKPALMGGDTSRTDGGRAKPSVTYDSGLVSSYKYDERDTMVMHDAFVDALDATKEDILTFNISVVRQAVGGTYTSTLLQVGQNGKGVGLSISSGNVYVTLNGSNSKELGALALTSDGVAMNNMTITFSSAGVNFINEQVDSHGLVVGTTTNTAQLANTDISWATGEMNDYSIGQQAPGWTGRSLDSTLRLASFSASVGTPAVPEPTTGALSLLALAGLCIRRRK